jgi:hypothetical protein
VADVSTEIAVIPDGVRPEEWVCEVYRGTGGMCLFIRPRASESGLKFWINESNRQSFLSALGVWLT